MNFVHSIYDKVTTALFYYFFLGGPVLALLASLFYVDYHLSDFFVWLVFHFVMVTGLGICYHRYFSHKSFEVSRLGQFFVALWGSLCLQRGPMWWAATHRMHHRFCGTPNDPHTPSNGGFYSHFKWTTTSENRQIRWNYVQDLVKFPELRVMEYAYLFQLPFISFVCYWLGGLPAMLSYQVAITTSLNAIASVNSMCHDRQEASCEAKNVGWIAAISAGEGLHANHHNHPGSASCSAKWYQIDLCYLLIVLMHKIGIVKSIRVAQNWDDVEEDVVHN